MAQLWRYRFSRVEVALRRPLRTRLGHARGYLSTYCAVAASERAAVRALHEAVGADGGELVRYQGVRQAELDGDEEPRVERVSGRVFFGDTDHAQAD